MVISFLKNNLGLFIINVYWIFLIILHNSDLSSIRTADISIQILFLGMIFFINCGYFFVLGLNNKKKENDLRAIGNPLLNKKIIRLLLLMGIILVLIGLKSGVFKMSYKAYFLRRRGKNAEALTGIGLIDYGINLFIYPTLLAVLFIGFYYRGISKFLLFISLAQILFYTYLTQTNYALIAAVYVIGVYFISGYKIFRFRDFFKIIIPLIILIVIAATTRFGKFDFFKIFKYYFVDYYTLGFYMFQQKIRGMEAAGLEYSFGRSLLGPIELYITQFFKTIKLGTVFYPVFTQNVDYNAIFIPSKINGDLGNAFATIAFTFYRDFSYPGVLAGGFFSGLFLGFCKIKEKPFFKIMYCYIIFVLLKGNSVSPFEQSYIYFTPIVVYFLCKKKINC